MAHTITNAYPNGLSGQLMLAKESVYGTRVPVTKGYPILSCSLAPAQEVIEPAAIKAGGYRMKRTDLRVPWQKGGAGTIELEVGWAQTALLFLGMLGKDTITTPGGGTNSRYHTCEFANPLPSYTIQAGVPTIQGVVEPFTFGSCMVTGWELSCAAGEILKLSLDVDAQMADHATTDIVAASYAASDAPFHWGQCVVKRAGTTLATVKSFSLKGTNPLNTERYTLDASGKKLVPLETGPRSAELTLEVEWNDITLTWDDVLTDTSRAVTIDFVGAVIESAIPIELLITLADTKLKGEPPTLSGPDTVTQTLTYDVMDAASPIVVRVTNTETTD